MNFSKQLKKRPLLTNSIAGFLIFSVGDFASQQLNLIQSNKVVGSLERNTLLSSGFLGIFLNGLVLPVWYRTLDTKFGSNRANTSGVLNKVLADQLVYAPFSISVFFLYSTCVNSSTAFNFQNNDGNKFVEKMKVSFYSTWLADCAFWPFVNLVNFRLIPIIYRPVFVGVAQVFWQSYVSHVAFCTST